MWEIVMLVCIAHVWSRGSIFRPLRERGPGWWRALADCPLCAGWWIGAVGHIGFCLPLYPHPLETVGVGAIVGTATLALYGLIRRI